MDDSFQLMLDQARERFRDPIPPSLDSMKFATRFFVATQKRDASEEVVGNAYPGKRLPQRHSTQARKEDNHLLFREFVGAVLLPERLEGCSLHQSLRPNIFRFPTEVETE